VENSVRAGGRTELGLWICGPFLGLLLVYLVGQSLPDATCCRGGFEGNCDFLFSDQEMNLLLATGVATMGACIAATVRLMALWQRRRVLAGIFSAFFVVLFLAVIHLGLGGERLDPTRTDVVVFGTIATGIALAFLLPFWRRGLDSDHAAVLLPLYLMGSGLFVYPALALLAFNSHAGSPC
jgi:hypothetical protein